MKEKRIVITGLGPLTSIGFGKEKVWHAILNERVNISQENFVLENKTIDKFYLHKIDNLDINNFGFDCQAIEDIKNWKGGEDDIDLYYFLSAIKFCLEDSKINYDPDSNDISLILGHGNPGLEQFWEKLFKDTYNILIKNNQKLSRTEYFRICYDAFIKSSFDLQTYMYLFHIGKIFNFHGFHLFVNNACASGLYGLEMACELIKSSKSKAVIVATAGQSRYYKYLWFKEFGYPYAGDGLIKPFANNANGMVLGDGSIALLVEDLDHALYRNATIYAEYLGGAFAAESWKVTLPAINTTYYQDTIKNALHICNLRKQDIDLINPHGTGLSIIARIQFFSATPFL